MTKQPRFTIASLFEGKSALVLTPLAADGSAPGSAGPGFHGSKGLGLEIENIAALPDAEDYSLHEFYRAHFTPSEIAYCIRQPEVKAAFQGLLAAKRAIVKSGAASDSPDARSIEIGFEEDGGPTYPGCLLSISDTGTIAAAVCLWLGGFDWPAAQPASGAEAARPQMMTFPRKSRILAFVVMLTLLLLFALGLWKVLEFMRHQISFF